MIPEKKKIRKPKNRTLGHVYGGWIQYQLSLINVSNPDIATLQKNLRSTTPPYGRLFTASAPLLVFSKKSQKSSIYPIGMPLWQQLKKQQGRMSCNRQSTGCTRRQQDER